MRRARPAFAPACARVSVRAPRAAAFAAALALGLGAAAAPAAAEPPIPLEWSDLLPAGGVAATGEVAHDAAAAVPSAETAAGAAAPLRRDWDGKLVSLPGYVVPLEYDGTGTTAFILVPFVGACIHVPPPPANQLVMVTTERPWEIRGPFDPVVVTGMFGAAAQSTALAEIGYALSADRIEPYPR